MDEHLEAWQIAAFILGGLDEDELEEVYRHFDECVDCVGGRYSGRGLRVSRAPGVGSASLRLDAKSNRHLDERALFGLRVKAGSGDERLGWSCLKPKAGEQVVCNHPLC